LAQGEGNFYAHAFEMNKINDNDQVLFRYCDESGNITSEANPNGSLENIAGVCNANRNVFGMMPHPERAADSLLGNQDGLVLFESILSMVNA
jgi:phosphoribosylformylglycinamidine (FGAM) synthase-like amidotransferase family enzyme